MFVLTEATTCYGMARDGGGPLRSAQERATPRTEYRRERNQAFTKEGYSPAAAAAFFLNRKPSRM